MSEGLMSIVIPTYNRVRCIARAIDSALGQTYGEVEVIVVDDGSTDHTRALVLDTYGGDGRVRYVHQPHRGVSAARDHGIRLSEGDLVAWLDSDDAWEPFKLDLQISCLRAFPDAGMVWSDLAAVRPDGTVISERFVRSGYGVYRMFSVEEIFDRSLPLFEIAAHLGPLVREARAWSGDVYAPMVMGNLVHTSTAIHRRERLAASGWLDEAVPLGEDYELFLSSCRAGRVAFVDFPTVRYEMAAEEALTRPALDVPLTRHFLETLTRALARDRGRIPFPERRVDEVLADAHRWLGEELLAAGERHEAQEHLLKSLLLS